jgi:hypothetical protein
MKLSALSASLAALAVILAAGGCAGEGGSLIKVDLGSWNCTMSGSARGQDSSGIGDTIKLDNSSDFNLDLTEQIPRMEVDLGTFVRMHLSMWQGKWSGHNNNGATFAFLGINFMNENITTDITVGTYEWGMEFCLVPLVDVVPEVNIRGYAGFGLKYMPMGVKIIGEVSGNVSETLPVSTPFIMLGAEADIARYFSSFFRLNLCKLAFKYGDFNADIVSTELKIGVGGFYRFSPEAKGISGPSVGAELGFLNNRLDMSIIRSDGSSSEQDFDFNVGFRGMFFQVVFSF